MSKWRKYYELEATRNLKNEGREFLGNLICVQEKRDGENVSMWLDDDDGLRVSSHNLEEASKDIISRLYKTPEYDKALALLEDERINYNNNYILYGELLKTVSPTRIEPKRKTIHWILFDIFDCNSGRYLDYTLVFQKAYHFKIPVVKMVGEFVPLSPEELSTKIEEYKKWCKKHRREGIVIKDYHNQIFAKEKIDLPKRDKIKKVSREQINYPSMPEEKILRALQHALDIVGEENWKDKSKSMPQVALQMATEAREHNFSVPRNIYEIYLNTPIEKIKWIEKREEK